MPDPIEPPAAKRPAEALELVSQALSDGDLEAALAQYESSAVLAYWPPWRRGAGGGRGDVRGTLACFMALRLPLSLRITTVLEGSELALVICERRVAGTGPDGWRMAADGWGGAELPLDTPEIPLVTDGDPVPGEGQGGPPHH